MQRGSRRAGDPRREPRTGERRAQTALGVLEGAVQGAGEARAARSRSARTQDLLDEKGRILSVAPRERLDAHKLIEDYMIAANVAAAKALEAKKAPVMYRVHEPPAREKLVALKEYLKTFGVEFALGQVIRPATFNHVILAGSAIPISAAGDGAGPAHPDPGLLCASEPGPFRACFGQLRPFHLADPPLFRSDRSSFAGRRLWAWADGGLTATRPRRWSGSGEHISLLERRAMEAERDTMDRYVAAYLSEKVGEVIDVADHRRPEFRLLRDGRGAGRRRSGAGARSRRRIFPL
jgi:ribonuclease R